MIIYYFTKIFNNIYFYNYQFTKRNFYINFQISQSKINYSHGSIKGEINYGII